MSHAHSHGGKECHSHSHAPGPAPAESEPKAHSHSHAHGTSCNHAHGSSSNNSSGEGAPPSHSVSLLDPVVPPPTVVRSPKPKSLWTQLLGNDDEEDEEDEGHHHEDHDTDGEEEEDRSGIQLLGQHLAKVKLEAEERAHQYRNQISQLEREKREQSQVLGQSQDRVLALEQQVRELEMQMTKKWQIEYRDNWIAQVDSLKQDKKKLKEENEQMKASIQLLQSRDEDDDDEYDEQDGSEQRALFAKTLGDLNKEKEANELLRGELAQAQQQLALSERTCLAFKNKLDKELELKWELAKRNHWEEEKQTGSLLDSIVHVIAPHHD